MRAKVFLLMTLLVLAMSLVTVSTVTAAPDPQTFGGPSGAWEKAPLGPGYIYTNTHNGFKIHWIPVLSSPHHVGLITEKPGANSNGAVADTGLPGASDVLPPPQWGTPN